MNPDDAFAKATLFAEFAKDPILNMIDPAKADLQSLTETLNKNNLFNLHQLPILLSKFVAKTGFQFVVNRIPALKDHLTPELIRVEIESDELKYLMESSTSYKPSIVFIVTKNIIIGLLGSKITGLKKTLSSEERAQKLHAMPKIDLAPTGEPLIAEKPAETYAFTFEPRSAATLSPSRANQTFPKRRLMSGRSSRASSVRSTMVERSRTPSAVSSVHSVRSRKRNASNDEPGCSKRLFSTHEDANMRGFGNDSIDERPSTSKRPNSNEHDYNAPGCSTMMRVETDVPIKAEEPMNEDSNLSEGTNYERQLYQSETKVSQTTISVYRDDKSDDEGNTKKKYDYPEIMSDGDDSDSDHSTVPDLKPATMKPKAFDFMELIVSKAPTVTRNMNKLSKIDIVEID